MNQIESTAQSININAFLADSRAYLAINDRRGAAREQSAISSVTARLQRSTMSSYRKVAQSFLLIAGLGAFAAGPVMADPGCGYMGAQRGGYQGAHQEHHAKMMEQHHKQLHEALKLTPEQEPAWNKLMETEKPRPAQSDGQAEDWAKLKAPERAEKMLELAKARQVVMAEHVAALKTFYALLTPEQQKIFEEQHAPRKGMRGKSGPKMSSPDMTPTKP